MAIRCQDVIEALEHVKEATRDPITRSDVQKVQYVIKSLTLDCDAPAAVEGLLGCPFCGSPTVAEGRKAGNGEWVALPGVLCRPCRITFCSTDLRLTPEQNLVLAKRKWNERHG